MNAPFFSVIVPVYNRASFLHLSIPSVLNQEFKNFELICIDDGSTDHSFETMEQFAKKDSRVKLFRNDANDGRCATRNTGIKNASAKWICFLDSDDVYMKNHLSVFNRLILRFPENFAFATSIKTDSVEEQDINSKEKISIVRLKDIIYSNILPPNVLCFNKEKINTLFVNENIPISEDWLFSRMLLTETEIIKTSVQTTIISEHEQRSMNTKSITDIAYWNEYTGKLFAANPKLTKRQSHEILSQTYLLSANILISGGFKKDSIPPFLKSFSFSKTFINPLLYKYLIKYLIK